MGPDGTKARCGRQSWGVGVLGRVCALGASSVPAQAEVALGLGEGEERCWGVYQGREAG